MLRNLGIGAALVLATLWIYGQTLDFGFVDWDDGFHVFENENVKSGLTSQGIVWAFTTADVPSWHPLTWISHMLDCDLYGLEAGGHHATNVLLHTLNGLLLFGLFSRLTGARWRSALVAGLFALHPLQVEAVAWISDRKELLSAFLALLSIGAYAAYARRGAVWAYATALALLALALMAKPMQVTLPFVFLLLDYWPLRRRLSARLLVEKLPFLLCVAAVAWVTLALQASAGALKTTDLVPVPGRIANAVWSYARYLGMALWPRNLTMYYPHPYIPATGGTPLEAWQIAGAAVVLAGVSAWVVRVRRWRWATLGWLWYLGTLFPVIGIVQVGRQALADRYMYWPSIGLFVIAAWGGAELVQRLRRHTGRIEAVAAVGIAALLVALAGTARSQAAHWRDSMSLFRHALEVVPRNPTIRYYVAEALREEGRVDEAIAHYRRALAVTPTSVQLHLGLGHALRDRGELAEAIRQYRLALDTRPDSWLAHHNLAAVYRMQGNLAEAIAHYRLSLRTRPNATVSYNLANALRARGSLDEAIAAYEEALELAPDDPRVHNNLGSALYARGDFEAAARHYRRALALQPDHFRAQGNLGIALQALGRLDEAIEAYRAALAIEPDYAAAHRNLAGALVAAGLPDEARPHYRRALELDPGDVETREALRELETRFPAGRRGS
jgi:tetratricopeptide (TPR) repeat protein